MSVEGVILDMDGLMLDTEPLYKVSWQRASAEFGYQLDDAFMASLTGRRNADCERAVVERFGPRFPLEAFRERWPAIWQQRATERGISHKAGLLEFLALLEERQIPTAVATSSESRLAGISLHRAGLDGRFAAVVTGEQVAHGKPAPDIYLEAARRLDVEPSACVALEDSEAGILAASGAGMTALLIPDQIAPSERAARAAFRVLHSLHEAREVVAALLADSQEG